jgi:hypothetical protein
LCINSASSLLHYIARTIDTCCCLHCLLEDIHWHLQYCLTHTHCANTLYAQSMHSRASERATAAVHIRTLRATACSVTTAQAFVYLQLQRAICRVLVTNDHACIMALMRIAATAAAAAAAVAAIAHTHARRQAAASQQQHHSSRISSSKYTEAPTRSTLPLLLTQRPQQG